MIRTHRDIDGVTLIEIMIVVSVIGILMLLVTPRIGPTAARQDVSGATQAVAAHIREARAGALQLRQPVTVTLASGFVTTTMSPGGILDTLGRPLNITGEFETTYSPASATLQIDASGIITSGTPLTFVATKRGESDTLRITGLGRVR